VYSHLSSYNSCAFVFVCELDENRLLAESTLSTLIKLIQEHVTSHEQKNAEVSLELYRYTIVLYSGLTDTHFFW